MTVTESERPLGVLLQTISLILHFISSFSVRIRITVSKPSYSLAVVVVEKC